MSTGRNPGTPRGPENQRGNLQGACDPDSPRIEVGPSRPRTRSQGRLDPSSEGAATSSRNQRQSSRGELSRGEQSSRDLPTGELQLLEVTEWPSTSQPSYFLTSHHSEPPLQSQEFFLEFLGPALRSTATMSHHVATPAPRPRSQAFLPVSGHHWTDMIEFGFDSSGPFVPVGQGFLEQATVQVPDVCVFFTPNLIGDIGGRVLRSHATASGHRSGALEVNPEVCLADQPRGRSLRRRATSPDSAVDSTAMENVPDTRSTPATPHRGRSASRSSRGASGSSRGASGSSRGASGSSRGASGSSGVQTQARANPSTSGNVFLKRTLPATSSSPFRRPVRMRASSPSPPRTPYPPCSQHNESSDSSSSSLLSLDSSSDSSAPSSPSK